VDVRIVVGVLVGIVTLLGCSSDDDGSSADDGGGAAAATSEQGVVADLIGSVTPASNSPRMFAGEIQHGWKNGAWCVLCANGESARPGDAAALILYGGSDDDAVPIVLGSLEEGRPDERLLRIADVVLVDQPEGTVYAFCWPAADRGASEFVFGFGVNESDPGVHEVPAARVWRFDTDALEIREVEPDGYTCNIAPA
jgi:hypothetical protein